MGFLGDLKSAVGNLDFPFMNDGEPIVFQDLPETYDGFYDYCRDCMSDAHKLAGMTVLALAMYPLDSEFCFSLLDILRGRNKLSDTDRQLIASRFEKQDFIARSFFKGSTPKNGYNPNVPYTVIVYDDEKESMQNDTMVLCVRSSGADDYRKITLKRGLKEGWYLWEQQILSPIQEPTIQ